jgi:hypothetical protein
VGCWLSRDPIEEKGCKSLYLACCNDMLSRVDRLGRNPAALVTLDVLVAGALSAMSFVAIEISQNSTGLESLAGVLNEAISGLEVCLESVRKLAVEAGVAISEGVFRSGCLSVHGGNTWNLMKESPQSLGREKHLIGWQEC